MSWSATEPVGWRPAHESAVAIERSDLAILRVFGRDPVRMVQGLLTNDVAALATGGAAWTALLTPKGRMLADLRVVRRSDDVLLICDCGAAANVRDTLRRYVPPLFARFEDLPSMRILGVYGPDSNRLIARLPDSAAGSSGEGDNVGTDYGTASYTTAIPDDAGLAITVRSEAIQLIRDPDAGVPGWLLIGTGEAVGTAEATLRPAISEADLSTFEMLRIEAGRPRWGAELSMDVIPIEAGLKDRAISTTKGCYTGQEVIVRILHRGHVNRRLMGLRLGRITEVPDPGTELFRPGEPKAVARVSSAVRSPTLRETIAMGYVRREIDAGAVLALGSPDGPEAIVTDLPFVS